MDALWTEAIEASSIEDRARMAFGPFMVEPNGNLRLPIEMIERQPKVAANAPLPWPIAPAPGWITSRIDDDWSIQAWCALGGEWAFEPLDINRQRNVYVSEQLSERDKQDIWERVDQPLTLIASGRAFAFCDDLYVLPTDHFVMNSFSYQPVGREPLDIFVGFRGHSKPYPEVVTPGVFRSHNQPTNERLASYESKARVAGNVVKQLIWESENIALTQVQARGILQHYGMIGPTDVLDLSYDINIAKWFSLNVWNRDSQSYSSKRFVEHGSPDRAFDECSVVYTVIARAIVSRIDAGFMRSLLAGVRFMPWTASTGTTLASNDMCPPRNLSPLWSQRPTRQSGFGVRGILPNENDTLGSILGVIEHRFHPTFWPDGWSRIGGPQLSLDGMKYEWDQDTSSLAEFILPHDNSSISRIRSEINRVLPRVV